MPFPVINPVQLAQVSNSTWTCSRKTRKLGTAESTHYKKGAPLEYVVSALLKLLRKGAPFYDQR